MGSLGDLHPMIALAVELKKRGHEPVINSWEGYREKIVEVGLEFYPLRPSVDHNDVELSRKIMDAGSGPEFVIKELIVGNVREMYQDLTVAVDGADLFLTGEIVYPGAAVAKITGVKWISTSLAPVSLFSAYDPSVYLWSDLLEMMRPLPVILHQGFLGLMKIVTSSWLAEYRKFRSELGLSADHDPMFQGKFSSLQHLVMFSKALAEPQPDWPSPMVQTGFCFYDESETLELQPALADFLNAGEPPIVFTLGSAAVRDARDFFDESAKAAKTLGRRAVLLYGKDNPPPKGLDENIVGFEFAPYSLVFPKAACVVHQAGVGTTSQVLRAGVPHLIVPFSHDQPDNAARCRRLGVAEILDRDSYNFASSANTLQTILNDEKYRANALPLKRIIDSENGTATACDAIEVVLRK